MEGQEIHPCIVGLDAIHLRQRHPLEEADDLLGQRLSVEQVQKRTETIHRAGIAIIRGLLRPQAVHQPLATEPLDDVVYRRKARLLTLLTFRAIELQAVAVAAQGIDANQPGEPLRLIAERLLITERERHRHEVEEIVERRLARARDLRLAEAEEYERERSGVVERMVEPSLLDLVDVAEVFEPRSTGVQLPGEHE